MFNLQPFLNLSLCTHEFDILKSTEKVFCRIDPDLDIPGIFSSLDWGYGFGGRIAQRRSAFSHHVRSTCYPHDLSLAMLTLLTRLWGICCLLHCKVIIFLFHVLLLRSQSVIQPGYPQVQRNEATPLRGRSILICTWNSSVRRICPSFLILLTPFKPQFLICEMGIMAVLT